MTKIKVLLKEPMKDFEELEIEDSFPIIKDIVGGPPKTANGDDSWWTIIYNEMAEIDELPYNCTINGRKFVGTILIVGYKAPEFADVPFTVKEIYKIVDVLL